jgi:hypothetical protein
MPMEGRVRMYTLHNSNVRLGGRRVPSGIGAPLYIRLMTLET